MSASASPPSSNRALVIAASLAVAVLGAWGALNSYQVSAAYGAQYPDGFGTERAQARFAPLAARVPASAKLGYLTDLDPSQAAYPPAFLSAQYAVAPRALVFLDGRAAPEWAVGNFSKPVDFAAVGLEKGYTMIADLGNGVILYHRNT